MKRLVMILSAFILVAGLVIPSSTGYAANTITRVRFINAAPTAVGANAVDFLINGSIACSSGCSSVAYPGSGSPKAKGYTSYISVSGTSITVDVRLTGTATSVLASPPQTITITAGTDNTIALTGSAAPFTLTSFVDNNSSPAGGVVRLRFINLIPGTTSLTLVADSTSVAGIASQSYLGASVYSTLPTGSATFGFTSPTLSYTAPRAELLDPTRVYTFFALGDGTTNQILQTTDASHLAKIYLPAIVN